MTIPRNDFDTTWKDILECYFPLFMQYCFPEIAKEIDWSGGYEMLDKELSAISFDAVLGNRLVDKLFKVWKLNGEETWVLFHIEVQGQRVCEFELRMFIYHYRLFDRYGKPVVSLAILTDDNTNWRPHLYQHSLWGCKLDFQFLALKLLDYADKELELAASNNPFAIVISAHLAAIQSGHSWLEKKETKLALLRTLYNKGFERQDILNLYAFIDWVILLPEPLAIEYNHEVLKLEEEFKMPYVTTAERLGFQRGIQEGIQEGILKGREEGIEQGIEQGIERGRKEGMEKGELLLIQRQLARKFGEIPIHYCRRLQQTHADELLAIADRILEAETLEDIFQ